MITEVRSENLSINIIILVVIFITCACLIHEKNILHLTILCLSILIIFSFLYKFRLFFEELFYVNEDYNGDIFSVIKATLKCNTASQIVCTVTFFSFFIILPTISKADIFRLIQHNPLTSGLTLIFSLLLLHTVDILDCRAAKVLQIFSSGGLDPGTAMASNYFYGYLKIVLPASGGNERAGILTSFERFEANHHIKIPVKKLFILIPSSSYIPPDLREASFNWMEHSGDLETTVIDRAGVKNRIYRTTVYQIRPEGPEIKSPNKKFIYLAVEGATPLKTFFEVQDVSHRYAPSYREYNNEIIRNFYKTLQNLLNDNPDCKDYCELVYYKDTIDGQRINPAHVLLERIARHSST